MSFKSTKKGLKLYRDEAQENEQKLMGDAREALDNKSNESINSEEANEIELQEVEFDNSWVNSILIKSHDSHNTRTLKHIKATERTHIQGVKMLVIILAFILIVLISVIRSNILDSILFHVSRCGWLDLFVCMIFVILCVSLLLFSIKILKKEYEQK